MIHINPLLAEQMQRTGKRPKGLFYAKTVIREKKARPSYLQLVRDTVHESETQPTTTTQPPTAA